MKNKKVIVLSLGLMVALVVAGFGYLFYAKDTQAPMVQAPEWKTYQDTNYGFEIKFPESWEGYSVVRSSWKGNKIEEEGKITGALIIFRNPNWTEERHWQDIPVMVFTHDVWTLVESEKIAVSAAPIGPQKIGENKKYVFATPPRWYGFTDDIDWQGAVEIVKTFTAND